MVGFELVGIIAAGCHLGRRTPLPFALKFTHVLYEGMHEFF